MLEAKKSAWFEKIFAVYNGNLFKRRFQALRVKGIENLNQFPLVIYCNHSSWWDGLVAFEISRQANLDSFLMMEEKQLKNYQLFRKLGAFSVVRENPRDAVESINYAANLLKEKQDRTIWIFPQGKILPNDFRPIEFYNGVSRIIEKAGKCYAIPLAMRYEFFGEYKPEVLVKIGEAELIETTKAFKTHEVTQHFAENLTNLLDSLGKDIVTNQLKSYADIL